MTIDEKIAALTEKIEAKKQKLSEITAVIKKKKAESKVLNSEIDSLTRSIDELDAQRLICKLKSKGVGITSVIEAVDAGVFDNENAANSTTENGAINSTTAEQEEKPDEISGSGKALGNA